MARPANFTAMLLRPLLVACDRRSPMHVSRRDDRNRSTDFVMMYGTPRPLQPFTQHISIAIHVFFSSPLYEASRFFFTFFGPYLPPSPTALIITGQFRS
jgi:hypothetical protein